MLIRVLKRRTSLEESFETFYEAELWRDGKPDLRLSVYEAGDDDEATQLYCEHAVTLLRPVGGKAFIDTEGIPDPVVDATPGALDFPFARSRHRDLVFEDEASHRTFAVGLHAVRGDRRRDLTKREVLDRVHALRCAQSGWNEILGRSQHAAHWLKALPERC